MLDGLEHELERVRAYRADVAEPDAATIGAARARLMEAIGSEPQPQARLTRNNGGTKAPTQCRRRFALAGGLVAAGVAAASVFGFQGSGFTPSPALAREMNQLATKVAASQNPTGTPEPGQYLYTVSYHPYPDAAPSAWASCVVSYVEEDQMWVAADGSGVLRKSVRDLHFASPAAQAACTRHGLTLSSFIGPDGGLDHSTTRFRAGSLALQTEDWKSLSTDPAILLEQVHQQDGGPDTPAELFTNVADFMHDTLAPPAILAALYQATALIPGVRSLGTQTTPDGQAGPAVAFYANGKPIHELIFDQRTGRLLEEAYYDDEGSPDVVDVPEEKIVDSAPNHPMESSNPSGSSGTATVQQGQPTTTTVSGATTRAATTTATAS